MKLTLPKRINGTTAQLPDDQTAVVIIGANGSGKTRFSNNLAALTGDIAFSLSALDALYNRRPTRDNAGSIDRLYNERGIDKDGHNTESTQLERLLALLMHDEMLNLINYKLSLTNNPDSRLQSTILDRVISLWQEVFPDNKVLIESGQFLFSNNATNDSYSSVKLSDGERAVLYYAGATLYAPRHATIFVDSPEMFLHPSIMQSLWNRIELMRPDCRFVYTTHDLDFAASRQRASTVWVRSYDPTNVAWDYEIMPPESKLSEEVYLAIIGTRKPVLFIEGDGVHSIDSKLYPLIFKDYTVKSLGSCNKVIEATRTFNDLNSLHHMVSTGIVDRDRRDAGEVDYLRGKHVMVPEVAEIENILMLEEVIRSVASYCGRDEDYVFNKVKKSIMRQFRSDLKQQALLHTRHRVKRTVEYRIDGKFPDIDTLEEHMSSLLKEINPRKLYDNFCREFHTYIADDDYAAVMRVYNQKTMIPASNVAALCGLHNKEEYINTILTVLRLDDDHATRIRNAVKACFGISPF